MQRLTFEKFCLVSCLGLLGLIMLGADAHAAGLQQTITSPAAFKLQSLGLAGLYLGSKLFRPETNSL